MEPPSVLTVHWYASAVPVAVIENIALLPEQIVSFTALTVTDGAVFMISIAPALVSAGVHVPLTIQEYK